MDNRNIFRLDKSPISYQITIHVQNILNSPNWKFQNLNRDQKIDLIVAHLNLKRETKAIRGSIGYRVNELVSFYGREKMLKFMNEVFLKHREGAA